MKYKTIPEAIEIANGTRYGLGASVFGPDQRLAIKVARRLECGMVAVNDFGVFYVSRLLQEPFPVLTSHAVEVRYHLVSNSLSLILSQSRLAVWRHESKWIWPIWYSLLTPKICNRPL